jgi:iron complex outermembrane recepter protein
MHFTTDGRAHVVRPLLDTIQGSVASVLRAARARAGWMSLLALCSLPPTGVALAAEDDTSAGDGLAEVIVSATHRDTNLQNTPISISAVSSEALTSSGVSSMQDLAALVPNLRMQGGRDGGSRINMRGIAAPSGEATVGLYYMDVPMSGPSDTSQTSGSFTQEINLFDVERIEALSGPQGTLYGAGAMGGTVRVLFNKANTKDSAGTLDTSASEINHGGLSYWVKGAYNTPLIQDVLGVRVALWREHRGGYVDNDWIFRPSGWSVNPGLGIGGSTTPSAYCSSAPCNQVPSAGNKDVNTADIQGGRVMLRFTPTEWLSWDGMGMYQRTASVGGQWDTNYPWNATRIDGSTYQTSGTSLVPTPSPYTVYNPVLNQQQDNYLLLSSPFKFTLPFVNLDVITSYYNWNRAVGSNYSDTYSRNATSAATCSKWVAGNLGQNTTGLLPATAPACNGTQQVAYANYIANVLNPSDLVKPNSVKSFINEARISSNFDFPLQFLLGIYDERRNDRVDSTEGKVNNNTGLVGDLTAFPVYWWRYITDDITQRAYFADLTWKPGLPFLPGLALNYGNRHFEYNKFTYGGVILNGYGDGNFVGSPQYAGSGAAAKGWLPKYNVSYQFSGPYMVYGTISKGYRPGGANVIPQGQLPPSVQGQFLIYQPDSVWNYEVGAKSSWLGNTLILNGSVYKENWANMQTMLRTPNNCCSYVGNAGDAQIRGTEWQLTYRAFKGFELTAGVSSNWKAELTSNQAADGVAPTNTQGHVGDHLPYVAKLNGSFDIDYKHPIGDAMALFRVNYSYTGSSRTSLRPATADPQGVDIGGFGTVNLRFGAEKDGWSAYLFVNNVSNRIGVMDGTSNAVYNQGTATTSAVVTQYYTDNRVQTTTPREAGINIRKEF